MPRTPDANAVLREQRQAAILLAAARVFARKGLAATKIADIATEAEMSVGLIYRYFAGKEQVFAQVAEHAMEGTTEAAQQALTRPGSAWERLRWFTAWLLPYQYEQPECSLVVLHALTSEAVPTDVREAVQRQNLLIFDAIRQLIAEGQEEGSVVRGDAFRLALVFLSAFQGLAASAAFVGDMSNAPVDLPGVDDVLLMLRAQHQGDSGGPRDALPDEIER